MAKRESKGVLSSIISRFSSSDDEGNATAMLRSDHRKVDALFQEFESADSRRKSSIANRTVEELTVHAALEEEIFYPAMEAELDDPKPIECAEEEHGLMKKLLEELAGMSASAPHFEAKYKVLQEIVRHHVREEESQILPAADSSDLDLDALGEEMLARKQELTARGGAQAGSGRSGRAGKKASSSKRRTKSGAAGAASSGGQRTGRRSSGSAKPKKKTGRKTASRGSKR
jgi:hemerythrin superfamily protein